MDELRELHLGVARPAGKESVLERLTAAYREAVAAAG